MKIKLPERKQLFKAMTVIAMALFVLLQIVALAVLLTGQDRTQSGKYPAAVGVYSESDALYLLRECGGKIGIFDPHTDILLGFIDVLVSTLPDNDRVLLRDGFPVYSFAEFNARVEDFRT